MRITLAALALFAAPPVPAQISYPPGISQDELATAITVATPTVCPAPMSDGLTASAGTADRCMPRADARRATQVQVASVVTAADGTFSGSWPAAWGQGAPSFATADIRTILNPYICQVGTITQAGFSGRCYELYGTTLGSTLTAIAGTVVSPVRNAAAGLPVDVMGRQ